MQFNSFDWRTKLGIVLTLLLLLASIVSFIFVWTARTPTDVFSAIDIYITYRWFAFFTISTLSIGGATIRYHRKYLYRLYN
ncbi:hypothetical protein CRN55_07495 [Vibrio vulnificus]|nr:hypothetical protein CRN55_07495 [Vibrio vulnificus]